MKAMTHIWIDVDKIGPLPDAEVWRLARTEYQRMLALLRRLDDAAWSQPTDCPGWSVRDMLGHLVGAAEGFSNPFELLHQYRVGAGLVRDGSAGGTQLVDGANAVQVTERAQQPVGELLDRYEAVIGAVLRWRRRLRHVPGRMDDTAGRFTLRQLFEVILTRDTWMHRLDVARATGMAFEETADHDGVILADAVRDWAGRHGQSFQLVLSGPGGGYYRRGERGQELAVSSLEFGRLLSGRGAGEGLLATRIVF